MDIISHGLWGGVAFGRKSRKNYWWAFFIGTAPDLFSFGVHTVARFLGLEKMTPEITLANGQHFHETPLYVHILYNWTHSLVIFMAVFLLVWLFRKKPQWLLGAWGLHILVDIPVHTTAFFPTPFLWPLSNFHVNGISWGEPIIFFPNWILIILVYGFWYWKSRKHKTLEVEKTIENN